MCVVSTGPPLCVDRGTLDDGQDVALDALARYVDASRTAPLAIGDLVNLVYEDNTCLLDAMAGFLCGTVRIDKLVQLLRSEYTPGLGDRHGLFLAFSAE